MAGYSGTPLAQKLGIVAGSKVVAVSAPKDYANLLRPIPEGVLFANRATSTTDIVHVFATTRAKLQALLKGYRNILKPTAAIWVSWPKKSANLPTEVTEDTVRELALPLGFVDVEVCAVTDVWSGLKLVVRKELQ
jgi:hypothetical protein